MKILLINSSYRINGNTSRVLSLYEEKLKLIGGIEGIDIETERVNLALHNISMCRGCRICFDKGEDKCPLKDDLLYLREKLESANAFIVAGPVYVEDVNGIMKNWIDRMAFISHRPSLFGKKALILTTSGIGSSKHALQTMSTAFSTWAINVIEKRRFRLGALTNENVLKSNYDKIIEISTKHFLHSIQYKNQSPTLYSLIAFKVQQVYWLKNQQYKDTVDYQYWYKNNWLDKGCTYYFHLQSNLLKIGIARTIGSFVSLFFV